MQPSNMARRGYLISTWKSALLSGPRPNSDVSYPAFRYRTAPSIPPWTCRLRPTSSQPLGPSRHTKTPGQSQQAFTFDLLT